MSEGRDNTTRPDELAHLAWSHVASCLKARKAQLYSEIRNYPTPITACDQQFNYLLEQLASVSGEISQMHNAMSDIFPGGDAREAIEEFVRSSTCLDDQAKQGVRAHLQQFLSKPNAKR